MNKYNLDIKDIEFVAFRRGSGPGGQHKNKTATSIRATHKPTGLRVEACNERSQSANKKLAIEMLQTKLDNLAEKAISRKKAEAYSDKSDASFASQIRTYRLCGNNQGVIDHRSGITHPNCKAVLEGDIERFIRGQINERPTE